MARRRIRVPVNVYLNARLVGHLRRRSSGAIDFQYDATWLDWEHAIPVSISLPLREDRYIGDPVIAVFDNLLPDDELIRRRVAARVHADGPDAYSLLAVIAGTVSARSSSSRWSRTGAGRRGERTRDRDYRHRSQSRQSRRNTPRP